MKDHNSFIRNKWAEARLFKKETIVVKWFKGIKDKIYTGIRFKI